MSRWAWLAVTLAFLHAGTCIALVEARHTLNKYATDAYSEQTEKAARYYLYETKRGRVFCPDASTVENPTDGVLESLIIPQDSWAIEFCTSVHEDSEAVLS